MLPCVIECTYIRNDFIQERVKNDVPFPMAIDYPNVVNKPQYKDVSDYAAQACSGGACEITSI